MQVLRDGRRPTISGGPMISGNYMNSCDEPGKEIRRFGKHRLVEECEEVAISAVQRAFGKKTLLAAIRQARPVRLPVLGGEVDLWLIDGPHHLPRSRKRLASLDDENCRLWLICPSCRKEVAKLYYYFLSPGSLTRSDLLCRGCHGLVYQSQNCGGNRWYRETVRPLKRLQQEKQMLQARHLTPRNATRQAEIERKVLELMQQLEPKTQRRNKFPQWQRSRQRRRYRDLSLVGTIGWRDREIVQSSPSDIGPSSLLPVQKTYTAAVPGPREQQLDEESRFWLDAISQFRREGLITDDQLLRFPKLRRVLEMVRIE
jgi:hypothetical protein